MFGAEWGYGGYTQFQLMSAFRGESDMLSRNGDVC
jgi:hypothetical protein